MSDKERRGSLLLKILYLAGFIHIDSPSFLECPYDRFLPQFEEIVSLSKDLLKDIAAAEAVFGKNPLCIDMGIIGPLFFTATRCRDPLLRREAATIIPSRRREGTWDGEGAAKIAQRLIAIEEEGLTPVKAAADVPESARICYLTLNNIDLGPRSASLSFGRDAGTFGSKSVVSDEIITW